jgi:membrane-bound metal-dependent hydrolase YbcI (DUF457 family)
VPFTVSHAAAVLPLQRLTRHRVPLAAMMIGSMAPDFQFFMPFNLSREFTHDFAGLFAFCWPIGLALWVLFVKVLERPTIEMLPSPWRERVPRSMPVTPRALLLASLGVLIGAMTHIAWDAFTHWGTPVSRFFPGLGAELFEFRGRQIHVFSLLQYLSSVAGLLALAYWGYNLRYAPPPRRASRDPAGFLTDRARILAALIVVGTSGLVALISFVDTAGARMEDRVFHLLVNGMMAWAFAWCVVAVMINRLAPARGSAR